MRWGRQTGHILPIYSPTRARRNARSDEISGRDDDVIECFSLIEDVDNVSVAFG